MKGVMTVDKPHASLLMSVETATGKYITRRTRRVSNKKFSSPFKKALNDMNFEVDKNGYVIHSSLGAFIMNVPNSIKNIGDLKRYNDIILGENPYNEFLTYAEENNYKLVIGLACPNLNGQDVSCAYAGVYLKNYLEVLQAEELEDNLNV